MAVCNLPYFLLLSLHKWQYGDLFVHCRSWVQKAKALLETGGAKVAKLDTLLAEVEQFGWGPEEVQADVAPLETRLREAKTWVAQVQMLLCSLSAIAAYMSGFTCC